jgi:hypothetical protein
LQGGPQSRGRPESPGEPREGGLERWGAWTLIATGATFHLLRPHAIDGDGAARYEALLQIADGRVPSTFYSVLQPLAALPLYVAGRWLGNPTAAVGAFNALVLLGTLAAFATMVRRSVDGRWLRAFLLLVLGGSMFTHHVAAFYGEVLTACALFVSLTFAARGRGIASGAAVLVAVVNTPASAIGAALAGGSRANTRRRALSSFVPLAVAAGAVLVENWIRRGSPFASGYGSTHGFRTALPYSGLEGFSYPLVLGIASELLSFGKGILFFAPGLWLAFSSSRRSPPATLASVQREALLVLAGLVLVYASWWSWYGGWFWGPRFLLFASFPASMMLASEIARPRSRVGGLLLVLVLVLGSVWVGVSGAVFGQRGLDLCTANQYQLEALCWYVPEFSPLVRPLLGTLRLEPRMLSVVCWFGAVAAVLCAPLVKAFPSAVRRQRRRSRS